MVAEKNVCTTVCVVHMKKWLELPVYLDQAVNVATMSNLSVALVAIQRQYIVCFTDT